MNLREIRSEFIRKSGRYDLIEENGDDAGANFFIQAGQRLLDKRGDFGTGLVGEWQNMFNKGTAEFTVPNCWSITSVYSRLVTASEWQKLSYTYSFDTPSCRLSNEQFYTYLPILSLPTLKEATATEIDLPASSLAVSVNAQVDDSQSMRIKLLPALSQNRIIRVVGNFFATPLTSDTASNYWSNRYPETLLKAAMYELEVFYRNTEGANDWLEAVMIDLRNLEQTELFASIQGDLTMGD